MAATHPPAGDEARAGKPPSGKLLGRSNLTYAEAVATQERLRKLLLDVPPCGKISLVAGADVAFVDADTAIAAILAFSWPDLETVDVAVASIPVRMPYVPGLLSFREVPAIEAAWKRLSARPQLLFCDGQGIAHPRRFGLACHVGVTLGVPTVGVAKSRLIGEADEPGPCRGAFSPLIDRGEIVGCVLRTRDRVKPLYVSPGHRMDVPTAMRMVLAAGRGCRLPEPTRIADALVRRARRDFSLHGG